MRHQAGMSFSAPGSVHRTSSMSPVFSALTRSCVRITGIGHNRFLASRICRLIRTTGLGSQKMGAAGCTMVLKPSKEAPLNAFVLADILDEIALPDGVFNLISGHGREIGETLASHPDVDMVSFTGSTNAGIRVGNCPGLSVRIAGCSRHHHVRRLGQINPGERI